MGKYMFKRYPKAYFWGGDIDTGTQETESGYNQLCTILNNDFGRTGNFGDMILQSMGYKWVNDSYHYVDSDSVLYKVGKGKAIVDIFVSENANGFVLAAPIVRNGSTLRQGYTSGSSGFPNYWWNTTVGNNTDGFWRTKGNSFNEYYKPWNTYPITRIFSFAPVVHPTQGVMPGLLNAPFARGYANLPDTSVVEVAGDKYYVAMAETSQNYESSHTMIFYRMDNFETTDDVVETE